MLLTAFRTGGVKAGDLNELADLLECEPVEYEAGREGEIATILSHLSTPEINGPITVDECTAMIASLATPHE